MTTHRRECMARPAEAGAGGGIRSAELDPALTIPGPTPESVRRGEMLYRPLGRTGELVSLVGLGGAHIGRIKDEAESLDLIRRAIDSGITFMDNSWDYSNGVSETRMGKALQGGYREKVFLMTKFDGRDKPTAARQIEESLRRLRTDRLDLLQFHEVIRLEDPDRFFAEGGALEAVREAQQAGKTRFIGFTGHKDPIVHLRMLEVAARHGFRFDTVQMPLNVMDAHFRSFTHQVLPVLMREQVGVLGMKSMGDQLILSSKVVSPIECLQYAMTLPTSVVITGIDSRPILDQAIEAVRSFAPLTASQMSGLLARTRSAAQEGAYERFKTSSKFDSTAKHPEWIEQPA
jgi:predicted aldo/keto reductase-like oxidoreductase